MLTLLILAGLFIFSYLVGALLLLVWAKIFRFPPVRFRWVLLVVLVVFLVNILLLVAFWMWTPQSPSEELVKAVLGIILGWGLYVLIFSWCFSISTVRAFLANLLWSVFLAVYAVAFVLLVKQYVLAGFIMPSSPMAPTLIGPHKIGNCPNCGKNNIVRYNEDPNIELPQMESELGSCPHCLQTHRVRAWGQEVHPPDRFFCNKQLSPERWDVVVFRFPKNPEVLYAMRLVGLPGEKVAIKEGAVWIDGKRLTPPEPIQGLKFVGNMPFHQDYESIDQAVEKDVPPREPIRLSPDGFFVLGDFTLGSSDSRDWGEVPRENLVGVVTTIYWPPGRWRILR